MDHDEEPQQRRGDPQQQPQVRIKLKRSSVACRRCRRLRIKCANQEARPPCEACREAGHEAVSQCFFPMRGTRDVDRESRRRRVKRSDAAYQTPYPKPSGFPPTTPIPISTPYPKPTDFPPTTPIPITTPTSFAAHESHLSPPLTIPDAYDHPSGIGLPLDEVIEGCQTFITSYYQLGFIAKAIFLERLAKFIQPADHFLVCSILSVSARFTPSLIRRYGGGRKATEVFTDRATALGMGCIYKPTIENTQAFFLLGLAEWGSGDKNRSCMHMGIAVRMASVLRLHREETHQVPAGATAEMIIASEVARRTFWVIQGQEALHSDHTIPASICLRDITALLPCEESDFAFGRIPPGRAALQGTTAALKDPGLPDTPHRSLFASLLQAQNMWGHVARGTHPTEETFAEQPWDPKSHYSQLSKTLKEWEESMDVKHRWSIWNLRGHKVEGTHLGYLSLVMVLRLCNIILRRCYLKNVLASLLNEDTSEAEPFGYWQQLSDELFQEVFQLDDQISAFIQIRNQDEGFPTEILFCVYICGSLASYLWQYPQLCPDAAPQGEAAFRRATEVLKQLRYDWPMAERWEHALRAATAPSAAAISEPGDGVITSETNARLPCQRAAMEKAASRAAAAAAAANAYQPATTPDTVPLMNGDVAPVDLGLATAVGAGAAGPSDAFDLDLDLLNDLSYGDTHFRFPEEWGFGGEL